MELRARTNSKEQKMALLGWLFGKGFLYHHENGWNPEKIEKAFPYTSYNHVGIDTKDMDMFGTRGENNLLPIIEFCKKVEEELNNVEE